jgi:hypothetical protein
MRSSFRYVGLRVHSGLRKSDRQKDRQMCKHQLESRMEGVEEDTWTGGGGGGVGVLARGLVGTAKLRTP